MNFILAIYLYLIMPLKTYLITLGIIFRQQKQVNKENELKLIEIICDLQLFEVLSKL